MIKAIRPYLINFIFYFLLQTLLFQNLVMFEAAICYVYLGYVFSLPTNNNTLNIIFSFLMGLSIDIAYDSLGVHAISCTFIGYYREKMLSLLSEKDQVDDLRDNNFIIDQIGISKFILIIISGAILHHIIAFYLDTGSFSLFIYHIDKVFFSILFTISVVLLIQLASIKLLQKSLRKSY